MPDETMAFFALPDNALSIIFTNYNVNMMHRLLAVNEARTNEPSFLQTSALQATVSIAFTGHDGLGSDSCSSGKSAAG